MLTGDQNIDEISRLGLDGLGRLLSVRTAVEPGRPMGVNILTDEIAFYPVLYWPVLPDAKALPEATLAKIDAYMKQGGLIIFDTQDYGRGLAGSGVTPGVGKSALQRIIGKLDVPRLEPVPENHVLTKAFYLLRNFPGRWDGGQLGSRRWRGSGQDRAAARASPTASPRSSSLRMISPRRGRWMKAAVRSIPPSVAARTSAKWPSAPASTSSCTH